MGSRAEQTRERIRSCAMRLFTDCGYAQTSVVQIAAAAGVSHMTFFRYFPTKESVVVSDPFDPVIAHVVAAQPREWSPVRRVVRGLLAAMASAAGEATGQMMAPDEFGARIRLAASVPDLRAAMWQSTFATQRAIAAALTATGVRDVEAQAAAGAAIGAATSALLMWAGSGTDSATDTLRRALESLLQSDSVA